MTQESPRQAATDTTGKRGILVLGMHRSGTSALTRVLNLLGADLGGGLQPANQHNHSGCRDAALHR